jgi:SAM-dependent methyltransferase
VGEPLLSKEALEKLLTYDFESVIDIGSGLGKHAKILRDHGKDVTTISLIPPADIQGDFMTTELPEVDCIWASHVLEHQLNVNDFLRRCFELLKEDGILAITVPPAKHNIVGGHLTIWNAGLLLYNLILAGFDCKKASIKTYGYNISVIVRKKQAVLPDLIMDFGDIEKLSTFFPNLDVRNDFDGQIERWNW